MAQDTVSTPLLCNSRAVRVNKYPAFKCVCWAYLLHSDLSVTDSGEQGERHAFRSLL